MKKSTFFTIRFWVFGLMTVVVAVVTAVAAIALVATDAQANEDYGEHVPGEAIACVATETYSDVAAKVANVNDTNAICDQVDSQIESALSNYDYETLLCATGDDAVFNTLEGDAAKYSVKNLSSDTAKPAQMRIVKIKFDEAAMSIGQMLAQLKQQPGVRYAEPNRIVRTQTTTDYSSYQYAYDNESTSAHGYIGMNVQGWNNFTTPNVNSSDKAVVAVIDTGVDYLHPDIKPSYAFWGNMKQYSNLGGQYGYNAAAEAGGDDTDPMDIVTSGAGHGTHCAGSICAQWNGSGVSGGAYDCSILPVRVSSDSGQMVTSALIKGYTYVTKTAQGGVNVKAVSCSWGGASEMSFLPDCVNLAGLSGVITVMASGNDALNLDHNIYSCYGLRNNPYTIIVNSTNCAGYVSPFSNYGVKYTDVFAPGDSIMSTLPSWTEAQQGKPSLLVSDTRFLQEGADYTKLDNFEGTSTSLQYWQDEACTIPSATAGTSAEPKGYNSDKALSVPTSYASPDVYITGSASQLAGKQNLCFLFNADVAAGTKSDYLACKLYDANKQTNANDYVKKYSFSPSANTCPFGCMSVPVSSITTDAQGNFKLKASFVYELLGNIETRTNCYIDDVSVATTENPYCFMSGTSMATPACAGATAVVACKYAGEDIKKIVARIKGGTNHKSQLAGLCYSEGIVDLTRASSTDPNTELDPVVLSAEALSVSDSSTTIKLRGYFLGSASSAATINGVAASQVVAGEESGQQTLTCTFPAKITGQVPVVVTKGEKSLTRYFDFANSDDLLERMPLPDKNSPEFADFYNADSTNIVYACNDYLLFECNKDNAFSYYTCNMQSSQWARSNMQTLIKNAFSDRGISVNLVRFACGSDNNLYMLCHTYDASVYTFKGFAVYNLADNSVLTSAYNGPATTSVFNTFIEDDSLYFALNTQTKNLYRQNLDAEECSLVASDIDWGMYPVNYKVADGQYLLVDIGNLALNAYMLTLNDSVDGVACQNLNQRVYPNITPGTGQSQAISYAMVDGLLMIVGPASFTEGSMSVTTDTYMRNLQTKDESALPGVLSHEMVASCSSVRNANYVFISFKDSAGPGLARRYVGTPTPTPDPTPGQDGAQLVSAATGDETPVLVLFGAVSLTSAILLFRKRTMHKYNF